MNKLLENFDTLEGFISTINKRENNNVMNDQTESEDADEYFTGTNSWDEAVSLFINGYSDKVNEIKKGLKEQQKLNSKFFENVERNRPNNKVVGYIPNVPNAIRCLPESMIAIDRVPRKSKTLHIIYAPCALCDKNVDWYIQAGVALVTAIHIVENHGIRTRLDCAFKSSEAGNEFAMPTVTIKGYGDRFNLTKICFPLIHPSMQRRLGFKWLETYPYLKDYNWRGGYGKTIRKYQVDNIMNFDKQTHFLGAYEIHDMGCNIENILKDWGVIDVCKG